jgi:hypothetical protein
MLDGLKASLNDGAYSPRSRLSLSEMLTFIYLPGGKSGGEGKSHDDCVVSSALLDQMLKVVVPRPSTGSYSTPAAAPAVRF